MNRSLLIFLVLLSFITACGGGSNGFNLDLANSAKVEDAPDSLSQMCTLQGSTGDEVIFADEVTSASCRPTPENSLNIENIDYFKNLEILYIQFNPENFSLEPILNLSNLVDLHLSVYGGNKHLDIGILSNSESLEKLILSSLYESSLRDSPAPNDEMYTLEGFDLLASAPKLKRLELNGYLLDDINFIKNYGSLESFRIWDSRILNADSIKCNLSLKEVIFDLTRGNFSLEDTCSNLITLDLRGVGVDDISSFSVLQNIEVLDLANNKITNISSLSYLYKLKDLNLRSNEIDDISSISELQKLEVLDLSYNDDISNFSSLAGLNQLKSLNLSFNEVVDLSPLSNILSINELYLESNRINDLSPLTNLTNLKKLNLENNSIEDISVISNLRLLEELFLNTNMISELPTMTDLTYLKELYLSDNKLINISPLSDLAHLETLSLNQNNIENIIAISHLSQLERLSLGENNISDLSALYGLSNLWYLCINNNNISTNDIEELKDRLPLLRLNLPCFYN